MLEHWDNAIVTDIGFAIYVTPGSGKVTHLDRPFHGLVLNDGAASKKIYFSDGTVLSTGANELHYLPKGSNYRVESVVKSGCWAINFCLLEDIPEKPFSISFRNYDHVLKLFKDATAAWNEKSDVCKSIIRKCIYDIIIQIKKEHCRSYMPSKKVLLIQPAIDKMNSDFTQNSLSVKELAQMCGLSEAYFRRIFMEKFSLSPKDYIISRRIEYAKSLLQSDQFSVSEVAQMCGYFEPCHFSREFSKHTGISPKDFPKTNDAE